MKVRQIEIENDGATHDTDEVWDVYANKLFQAFGDITRRNMFMPDDFKRLYVSQRVRELDEHFLNSLVFSVPPIFAKPELILPVATSIAEGTSRLKSPWSASETAPFLLLGGIGVGKSTYLEHFFLVEVKEINPDIEGIIIDFKLAPTEASGFTRHLLEHIDKQLIDIDPNVSADTQHSIQLLFQDDFDLIDSQFVAEGSAQLQKERLLSLTLFSAREKNIIAMTDMMLRKLNYLRSKGKTIWLALDNIDQHFYSLHSSAFIQAIAIADKLGCRIIIVMRYLSLKSLASRNVYDSYSPRKLKLSPPKLSEVLLKRLDYFRSENKKYIEEALAWTGGTLKIRDLADDIELCVKLIAADDFVDKFLMPLANFNIRKILQLVLSCFQSYYFFYDRFNNSRYLATNQTTLKKRFLYAHLLKNVDYFYPEPRDMQERCVINLFDNDRQDSQGNQTIRIRLLQYLLFKNKRVSLKELAIQLQAAFSYTQEDIAAALQAFISCELVAITNVTEFEFDTSILHERLNVKHLASDEIELALSYCGKLHFELIYLIDYVEIMKFSTFVDGKDYILIQGEENQRKMSSRYHGTMMFLDYLAREERREIEKMGNAEESFKAMYGVVFPSIIQAVKRQYEAVQELYTNQT